MIKGRVSSRFPLLVEKRIDIEDYFDLLIVPQRQSPVLVMESQVTLKSMRFSLLPRWAKEPKVKFATHNARLETVIEKPTWRDAFKKRHCVVPMTDFIEPIYEGEHAGYMVSFQQKRFEWLWAAGIWEEWTNTDTGEVIESFAILTSDPPNFVHQVGHDRCPLFLPATQIDSWLGNNIENPMQMIDFLLQERETVDFSVERFRAMKPGWEKRK